MLTSYGSERGTVTTFIFSFTFNRVAVSRVRELGVDISDGFSHCFFKIGSAKAKRKHFFFFGAIRSRLCFRVVVWGDTLKVTIHLFDPRETAMTKGESAVKLSLYCSY